MKKINKSNKKKVDPGIRIFGVGEEISNDSRGTGLNNNDLIIGGSGSGKTGGYVVPAIQNISGSLVVSDTKGQLEKRFRKELEKKGYNVYLIDFVHPERSDGYNPLDYIVRMPDGNLREKDILSIAAVLCPQLDQKEPIWCMCAKLYVAFLIGYCLENDEITEKNLHKVCDLRREFSQKDGDLLFSKWLSEHKDSFSARKYSEIIVNKPADKMWASIEGFVNAFLEPLECREMDYIFRNENNIDLNVLGQEKTVLFINQSDTDRAFDPLVTLLHKQILQVLCEQADQNEKNEFRLDVPVRMILDDFAAGCAIPDFDKIISVIRSRDISVNLMIQSLSQLNTLYDQSMADTIINNCDNLLYLGSNDPRTAGYLSLRADVSEETIHSMPINKAYLFRSREKGRMIDRIIPYSTL